MAHNHTSAHSHILYKTGVWLSVLCTIHCLAMPFLITALPFLSGSFIDESVEVYLVGGSLILALILLIKDYRQHGQLKPLLFFMISSILNIAGFFTEGIYETSLHILGAIFIGFAYYINWIEHKRAFHE
jgi:hypothetical protein